MAQVSFVVNGPPRGYLIVAGRFYNTKRKKAYLDYKKLVQQLMPDEIREICAGKERPVIITTRAFFENGTHPDPENVHKGIKDAIFYQKKGGDKHTGGSYSSPLYDKQNPRVEVTVTW